MLADSDRLRTPGADPNWREVIDLAFFSPRGSFGGHVTVVRWPHLGAAWFWAAVVESGSPLVTVIETHIELRSGLEFRAQGIWADHNCETPFEHWSYGLEAFAVAVEEPDELVIGAAPARGTHRDVRGIRTPLGWDMEWQENGHDPVPISARSAGVPGHGYRHVGRVHGEILVGSDSYELDGHGVRSHAWGTTGSVGAIEGSRTAHGSWSLERSSEGDSARAGELCGVSAVSWTTPDGLHHRVHRVLRGGDVTGWTQHAASSQVE